MHCTTLYNFFFQNIVYPSVVCCCRCCCCFFILQNPVHLVSALRLGDILIIGEERREKRREEEKGRKRRTEKEKLSSALSEDAVLRIVALFCPAPQSEGNNTEASLLCSKGMKLWVRFKGEINQSYYRCGQECKKIKQKITFVKQFCGLEFKQRLVKIESLDVLNAVMFNSTKSILLLLSNIVESFSFNLSSIATPHQLC